MHLSIEGSGIVFEAAKVVDFDNPIPHMYFLVDEKLSRTRNPLHSTTSVKNGITQTRRTCPCELFLQGRP